MTTLLLAISALATAARQPATVQMKPTIVLVHGAFAGAQAWSKVVPMLQKDGYKVVAVQDPMTSLADDIAATKRVLEAQKGPIVLVGHSYGGCVISGAALGNANVNALVFIGALTPDQGVTVMDDLAKFPTPLGTALVPDSAGFLTIDTAKYHDVFTADIPVLESKSLATMQGPIKGDCFGTPMGEPAWKTIPSWFLICKKDLAVNPELQRLYAKRMNAKVTEVDSSHTPFLSKPGTVVKIIEAAAASIK